jgi:hypothetical protein
MTADDADAANGTDAAKYALTLNEIEARLPSSVSIEAAFALAAGINAGAVTLEEADRFLFGPYGGMDANLREFVKTTPPEEWETGVVKVYDKPPENAQKMPILRNEARNHLAALYHAGKLSEGELMRFCENVHKALSVPLPVGGLRLWVRELCGTVRDASREVISGNYPGQTDRKRAREGAMPSPCPVCFFTLYVCPSMGMESGMNIGMGFCIACGSQMEIRRMNRAGEPDLQGESMACYRVGCVPVASDGAGRVILR